jgi:hypothetical protein
LGNSSGKWSKKKPEIKNNTLKKEKRIDKKLLDEMLPVDDEVFENLFSHVKQRKLSPINKL